MTTWEYSTVPLLTHATKQILDTWGDDGWELVTVMPGPTGEQHIAYMKRPKGDESHGNEHTGTEESPGQYRGTGNYPPRSCGTSRVVCACCGVGEHDLCIGATAV